MTVTATQLGTPVPDGGWPEWVFRAPYAGSSNPQSLPPTPMSQGANCQRFAYGVLRLFGRAVPPHRSSELWGDARLAHVDIHDLRRLDLVLFNRTDDPWGAHIAVALDEGLLHLCSEVGRPAVWAWSDFAERERYQVVVGAIRVA